ncbi:hypothetical protein NW684_18685 [Acinetobacter baumannii]|nr:hypothetical protein [Acinetobacter baumannii]
MFDRFSQMKWIANVYVVHRLLTVFTAQDVQIRYLVNCNRVYDVWSETDIARNTETSHCNTFAL